MKKLSIVIPNYNYGRFVGDAVRSALAVDWPDVEVIVVDDGSTDDSLKVLACFGDRITVLTQENSGPRVACNHGYAESTGDVVIFLDSDDVLAPSIAQEIASVWRAGISKVQVQMHRIDADGRTSGRNLPHYRRTPTPNDIRRWMSATAAYPTPPGSGNAYARAFLDRLMPLDDRCGDATDSACLAAAPYLGDVVTIPKPLVGYRVHGSNRSGLRADPARFVRQIDRAVQRQLFANAFSAEARHRGDVMQQLRRGRHLLQMRVAAHRVCGSTGESLSDTRMSLVRDAVVSPFAPGPEPIGYRLLAAGWSLTVLVLPTRVAVPMISWRFA
ncbi:MAG: glycosyltransferase family 2 protein [Pseudonocardia sp.]